MKIALVGVGGMGSVHFNIYKGMQDIELVALCDIRMDMLKEKAGDLKVNLYADIDEMLAAEKPDLVDICTPSYLHVEQAIKSMEAGAHVLSEKPISMKKEDVKRAYDCAEKNNVCFMVAQVLRFWD